MPANKSSNKVRVTRLFGAGDTRGLMDPHKDMQVKYGISPYFIVGLQSGNFTVDLALHSGGPAVHRAYPHMLIIDEPTASGYGWPTSGGSVLFGHHGAFPNGVPGPYGLSGSGMVYEGGDGTEHVFSR